MKKQRILVIMHKDLVPPDNVEGMTGEQIAPFQTEYDVIAALKKTGHDVHALGISSNLGVLRQAILDGEPHIVFNLLEEFDGEAVMDYQVVSYLELLRMPYTGCCPRGMLLARDKALSKQILAYHRILVPEFAVFPLGQRVHRPRRLGFPLFVKSLNEEASLGISQASIVEDDAKLQERVAFIHDRIGTDAIAEQYIAGREFYVGILGNQRLKVLPIWELLFTKMPEDVPRIATAKVKWDLKYQKRRGIKTAEAKDLPEGVADRIRRLCKRIYRILDLTGYARIDLRMTPEGRIYVLEANPNPQLANGEDLAEAAKAAGISYEQLCQRIVELGLRRARK
ncbi:MAG TPA: D-alanine--D-alanine ligase [Phycisphaerae bacterium]|nr:D-alanine--D-alanine ligase [Phycisphaerae bacterium]